MVYFIPEFLDGGKDLIAALFLIPLVFMISSLPFSYSESVTEECLLSKIELVSSESFNGIKEQLEEIEEILYVICC